VTSAPAETAVQGRGTLPAELTDSTPFLLKRLGFIAKDRSLEAYQESGLHPYHHAILLALAESPRETQGSIADALGYDRGQLVGLLDELESRGLVARRAAAQALAPARGRLPGAARPGRAANAARVAPHPRPLPLPAGRAEHRAPAVTADREQSLFCMGSLAVIRRARHVFAICSAFFLFAVG
jgi:hypothetical protein